MQADPAARPPLALLVPAIAALVAGAARLGLHLSIGSSGITPLWPASGIAFAAVLLYRRPGLAGVALGALVHYVLSVSDLSTIRSPAVLASVLGLTALLVLESGLGALLAGNLGPDLRAHPVRTTMRFIGAAAVATLPSALLGNWLLHVVGDEAGPLAQPFFRAFTWWVGDTAGILLCTPPLLVLLAPALRADRMAVQAFPALSLGLGFTLFTTYATGLQAREARLQRFDADSRRLAVALATQAELASRDLETLQHVFQRVAVDRTEFATLAQPLLDRSPWQTTFAWLPRVAAADRLAFESSADGLDGVSIRRLADDGSLVRAAPGPVYYPTAWTVPRFGREQLVGVDNAADHWRGPAVAHALASGRLAVTAPLHLVANSTDERLVQVMYAPIEPTRGLAAAGLVSATIDLERLMGAALAQRELRGQQVLLFDPVAPDTALRWRDAGHFDVLDATALRDQLAEEDDGIHRRLVVPVADRQWVLVCRPDWAASALPGVGWVQGGVFFGGLAFTALVTGFLMARRRRDEALVQARARLEDQVAARTADLAATNDRLRAEIEDHRRTEDLLQEARQRAESASRAKSLFLANMSHEIRTPLNAVLGYAQLLIEDRRQPPDARERLRVILAAGQRLLGLINDVLDLAKIEAGGLQLREEALDLRRELEEVATLFAPRAAEKGLWLRTGIDLDGSPVVRGDRAKLGQIVLNLLGNALKFTAQGGITLSAWREGVEVVVEVADTGPGMSEAERADLFTPFRQGAAGRDKGGTGLGLALSRNLAQAMGGGLSVDSAPGQGTRVRLSLPLAAVDEAPAAPPAVHAGGRRLAPGTRCRALVVEDDDHSRDVLVSLLARAGCDVGAARDGQEGLEACLGDGQGPVLWDIVFSDIRMPRLDGLRMMRALRADPRSARVPLIAVSASSLEHQRRDYIEQGFDDFVSKPYGFDEIHAMLANHAGARLVDAGDEAEADVAAPPNPPHAPHSPHAPAADDADDADAGPAAPPRDAAWRSRLEDLREAASGGVTQAVRRALAALAPGDLSPPRQRQAEADARAYDFDALAARVRDWLAEAPPAAAPGAAAPPVAHDTSGGSAAG